MSSSEWCSVTSGVTCQKETPDYASAYVHFLRLPSVECKYAPLSESEPHIRLLMLCNNVYNPPQRQNQTETETGTTHQRHPTGNSGMLSGILFSIPIAGSETEYHALSYTWGKDEKTEAISTNLGLVSVTANLDSAIRRLLCDYGPGICVWADALCINQDDAREKSRQIRLMPSIYSNANLVVAYLGREDEDSEAALELVKKISEISLEKTKPKPNGFDDLESCGLPRKDDQTWTAFHRFVSRAWFRRVWIIQEFVLARNIILLWGLGRHLKFEALIVTVLQIAKLGFVPFVFAYQNSNKPPPSESEIVGGWRSLVGLVTLRQELEIGKRPDLFTILNRFRQSESKLERDHYFALVPLSTAEDDLDKDPDIGIDYEEDFASVATRFIRYMLKTYSPEEGLKILSLAQPRVQNLDLPSWVPHWSQPLDAETMVGLHDHSLVGREYNAATGALPVLSIAEGSDIRCLKVRGVQIGRLVFVGNDYWIKLRGSHVHNSVLSLLMEVKDFKQRITSYATGETVRDVLWKTLTLNQYSEVLDEPSGFDTGLPTVAVMNSVSVVRRLFDLAFLKPGNLIQEFGKPEIYKMAVTGFLALSKTLRGWKPAILSRDLVSMVTVNAEVGDTVAIISGTRVPYVLRQVPSNDGTKLYRLVGECYVHGVMNGEFLKGTTELEYQEIGIV